MHIADDRQPGHIVRDLRVVDRHIARVLKCYRVRDHIAGSAVCCLVLISIDRLALLRDR